jgi:hypothetical protein
MRSGRLGCLAVTGAVTIEPLPDTAVPISPAWLRAMLRSRIEGDCEGHRLQVGYADLISPPSEKGLLSVLHRSKQPLYSITKVKSPGPPDIQREVTNATARRIGSQQAKHRPAFALDRGVVATD